MLVYVCIMLDDGYLNACVYACVCLYHYVCIILEYVCIMLERSYLNASMFSCECPMEPVLSRGH